MPVNTTTCQPLTPLRTDGSWTCDITTGGLDEQATQIAAFVVPQDYSPPQLGGQTELPHGALGLIAGGSVETRRDDRSGLMAADPQFVMRIAGYEPKDGGEAWTGLPGEKVALRFTLPSKPLLHQWIDRLHKLVQGRVQL